MKRTLTIGVLVGLVGAIAGSVAALAAQAERPLHAYDNRDGRCASCKRSYNEARHYVAVGG